MITENWCIVTLDSKDLQLGRVDGRLEINLPEMTSKVVIKIAKESVEKDPVELTPADFRRSGTVGKVAA